MPAPRPKGHARACARPAGAWLAVALLPVLAVLALCGAAPRAAEAGPPQGAPDGEPKPGDEREGAGEVYLDEDDDADHLLRLAARHAADGRWKQALDKYQECLRLHGGRVTRAAGEDRELYRSVGLAVLREMARTPKEGREVWRVLTASRFQAGMRAALAAGADPQALERLSRDFAGLEFCAQALLALAEAHYARGDISGAAAAWRRLLREYPDGDYGRTRVLARAGLAAAASGLEAEARSFLEVLRTENALAEVRAGGVEVRAVEAIEKLLARGAAGPAAARSGHDCWGAPGGDPARSRPAPPLVRPTMLRWRRELPVPGSWTGPAHMRQMAMYGMNPAAKTDAWPYPPYHPAACGEVLLLSGEAGVMALRCHDGEPVWSLPEGDGGVASESRLSGPAVAGGLLVARQGQVALGANMMWGGMSQPGASALTVADALTGRPRCPGGQIESPAPARFDEPPEDEPEEAAGPEGADGNAGAPGRAQRAAERTAFVSVPVLTRGLAVSGAVRRSAQPEYELVAFEPGSGRLRWRTYVCGGRPVRAAAAGNWGGMGGQVMTETGQPPAASGRSVCAVTNLGALAAVDAEDGSVQWLRLYPRYWPPEALKAAGRAMDPFGRGGVQVHDPMSADMWEPGAPVLAGTLLVAAPQDCDHLLAVDAETGRLVWRAPRAGLRRLVGAVDGRIVLTGADQVVVREASGGKALWRRALGARVIGHGTVGKGYIAVSTAKALEVMDLDGRPLFSRPWKDARTEAGNVLVHGENVFTVSATHVNAWCDMDRVVARLAAESRGSPGAALPRFLAGTMELAAGRRAPAAAALGEALKLVRPGEKYAGADLAAAVRAKLWQCHWENAREARLRKDRDAELRELDAAVVHAPGAEDAARTLLARVECLRGMGRAAEALETCQRLAAEHPDAPCERQDGSRLRAWLLARAEAAELLRSAGPEIAAAYEQKAAALLEEARSSGRPEAAWDLVKRYPNSRAAGQGLLLAAELAARAGRTELELRCLRQQVFIRAEGPEGLEAHRRLAAVYDRLGYFESARRTRRQLVALGGKLQLDGREVGAEDYAAARPGAFERPRPALAPPLAERWRAKLGGAVPAAGCAGDAQLVFVGSPDPENAAVRQVFALDAATGRRLWSFDPAAAELGTLPMHHQGGAQVRPPVAVEGDAVVLATSSRRAVLDRSDGRLRWSAPLPGMVGQVHYYNPGQSLVGGDETDSCADGVLAAWELSSRVNQLGAGEVRRLVRAVSVDDGAELWSIRVGKDQPAQPQHMFYGRAADGVSRIADGRLVAWTFVPARYDRGKQTRQKTTFLTIDAPAGALVRQFEADGASPLGVYAGRLVCLDQEQKLTAFDPEGGKAWVAAGRWQLVGASERRDLLVLAGSGDAKRARGGAGQEVAALEARGGRLLWKQARGQPASGGSAVYNPYYGHYGRQPALVLPRVVLMDESLAGNPYVGGQPASALSARDAADGRLLWETPFAAQARDRLAGENHLACALGVLEHLDEDDQVIDYRHNPFARNPARQRVVKALRYGTVLRLFDLSGGKAVWEWSETRTLKLADGQQPWAVQPRQQFAQVMAVRDGLVVTTPDEVVMLGAPGGRAEASPDDSKPGR